MARGDTCGRSADILKKDLNKHTDRSFPLRAVLFYNALHVFNEVCPNDEKVSPIVASTVGGAGGFDGVVRHGCGIMGVAVG